MKRKKKKRKQNWANSIQNLVPLIMSVAVTSTVLGVVCEALKETYNVEIRLRLLEFKKMGVTEYLIVRRKTEVVYDYLKGLERKLNQH
jgi:hypothetical protein